jgi:hypothetical protein
LEKLIPYLNLRTGRQEGAPGAEQGTKDGGALWIQMDGGPRHVGRKGASLAGALVMQQGANEAGALVPIPICDEKEWITYVGIVMKLEIHKIELVVKMGAYNDVGDEDVKRMYVPRI